MPKIVHLADVHIGKKFHKLGHKGDVLREQIFKSFTKALTLAVEEKVDLVMIAGDLFDSNRVSPAIVRTVTGELNRIAPIPVIILPGTHDCYDTQSVYRRKDWELCPHVRIFREKQPQIFTFPHLGVAVHGVANQSNKGPESPLSGLKPSEDILNLAVAHGSLKIPGRTGEDDYIFTSEEIKQSGMDYIALGHWHRIFDCSEGGTKACYSGAPQQLSFSQGGGTVNLVHLTKDNIFVDPRPVGCSPWITLNYSTPLNFVQIAEDLAEVPTEGLIKISLTGNINRKEREDLLQLVVEREEKCLHIELNWTECRVARERFPLESFPQSTVGYYFGQWMSERIAQAVGEEQELLEEAMHLGMDYLQG